MKELCVTKLGVRAVHVRERVALLHMKDVLLVKHGCQ